MLWLLLSLFSAVMQSTSDLFSKKSLTNLDAYLMAFSVSFFSSVFILPFVFFKGIPSLDSLFWFVLLVNVCLIAVARLLYMKALKASPLSLTSPMLAFTPFFLLVTSPILLGEFPSLLGLAGILLIVLGTYALSLKEVRRGYLAPFKVLKQEQGSMLMLVVAFIFSVSSNLLKIGVQHSDPFFYSLLSNAIISWIMFPVMLQKSKKPLSKIRSNYKILILLGLITALQFISARIALETTLVPYVISLRRASIIFSVIFGYFFFKEKQIVERLTGAVIMVLGILLISLA